MTEIRLRKEDIKLAIVKDMERFGFKRTYDANVYVMSIPEDVQVVTLHKGYVWDLRKDGMHLGHVYDPTAKEGGNVIWLGDNGLPVTDD